MLHPDCLFQQKRIKESESKLMTRVLLGSGIPWSWCPTAHLFTFSHEFEKFRESV